MSIIRNGARRTLAILVSLAMAAGTALPSVALAATDSVRVDAQSAASATGAQVSGLEVGGVDAPAAGQVLDDTATVSAQEGEQWEVPVLWLAPDLELATIASGGELPVIAYFVPQDLSIATDAQGGYTIRLSTELQSICGGQDIITIYDASTGITYLLPSSLRAYFNRSRQGTREDTRNEANVPDDAGQAAQATDEDDVDIDPDTIGGDDHISLIDIYCSKTAKNALSEDDLNWLLDLVLNKLQPQAVNLLISKFPAFEAAAQNGELGKEIGLYVYYMNGDKDGNEAHEDAPSEALAYVGWKYYKDDAGAAKFGYLMGIDTSSITATDPTGKLVLLREGYAFENFQNTLVHELFHGLMDDYNRTGMAGTTNAELATVGGSARNEEWRKCHYPDWFIEGSASAVENNLQYRKIVFDKLTEEVEYGSTKLEAGSSAAILYNYINSSANFNLAYSYKNDTSLNSTARYVTGYLAVLYLGELAAQKDPSIGSSLIAGKEEGSVSRIDSSRIRLGLNSILERMHKGETLDQVINDISPIDPADGEKYFPNTDLFEDRFVVGFQYKRQDGSTYYNVNPSTEFLYVFFDQMNKFTEDSKYGANGSILNDFYYDYRSPLDPTKSATTNVLKITESNTYVDSTVSASVALAGGGTSKSGTPVTTQGVEATSAGATEEATAAAEAETAEPQADAADVETTDAASTEQQAETSEAETTEPQVETTVAETTEAEAATTETEAWQSAETAADEPLALAAKEAEPEVASEF